MSIIINALEQYHERFGEYPVPANPSAMGSGSLSSHRVCGALALYQAITGDGNDQILIRISPGNWAPGTTKSDGKIDEFERSKCIKDDLPHDLVVATRNGWILVDSLGRPFQYEPAGSHSGTNYHVINTTFDIWSIGRMKPELAPSAPTKAQKLDGKLSTSWIKNW